MTPARSRLSPLPILATLSGLVLSACVGQVDAPRSAALSVAAGDLPPIPICREEMRAYVELTRLAKLHGEGWAVFDPAVAALKQQILDCLGDNTVEYHAL